MSESHLIFVEPPEDVDETFTHGAMLGGMTGYDDESLAGSYFLAGEALIDCVLSNGERGQELICPILYMYRHGIELYLKVIVKPTDRNHSIGSLFDAFCKHVSSTYKERVPVWVTKPVTQLAEYDPGSDLFRYGQSRPSSRTQRLINTGELWVDLRILKRIMAKVEFVFRRVHIADQFGIENVITVQPRSGSVGA
jgi:hypothetical protein